MGWIIGILAFLAYVGWSAAFTYRSRAEAWEACARSMHERYVPLVEEIDRLKELAGLDFFGRPIGKQASKRIQ